MTRSPVWHPFTQHGLGAPIPRVDSSRGAWLDLEGGGRLLDAISSWWVITHGHGHPAIVAAIREQAATLDQVIFAGLTHAPAEQLATALVAMAPPGLTHVFYSDSGSTAVEVAIKMALGFWRNRGEQRSRIVTLEHSYHGDTVGTMSVGARGPFNAAYEPLLFEVTRLPFPHTGKEAKTLDAFEASCRAGPPAAVLVEPLILGAGGMLTYAPDVLRELRRICDAHGVLLIADEVMTGWGRSGTLFACEQAAVTPDILCTAKGLTGGALPLAATLCTAAIFDAHRSDDRSRMLFHSSSFTANPLCCAAALANVGIWHREPVLDRVQTLCDRQRAAAARLRDDARFSSVRTCGTILAVDLKTANSGYLSQIAPALQAFFIDRGVLLRPLGNTIYVMPPYCITAGELDLVYDAIAAAAGRFAGRP